MKTGAIKAALLGLAMAGSVTAAQAADPAYVTFGVGSWETLRPHDRTPEVELSFHSDYKLWIFRPMGGVVVARDGDFYGYGGLQIDMFWGKHFVTTVSTAAGLYSGGGYDLGAPIEFRSGIEAAYRFEDGKRLGAGFFHISNAGQTRRNPGSESAIVTLSLPVGHIWGAPGDEVRNKVTPAPATTASSSYGPSGLQSARR